VSAPAQPLRAFVLISFEDEFTSVYEGLIKAPLEEAGYEVRRADSELNQQNILRDIVQGIASADLIVADVTGLNPNVFYELGLAHALGIPTILITQNIEELPFDLRAYRANEYSTNFAEAPRIAGTIRDIGNERARGALTFGSPVTDFLRPEDIPRRPSAEGGAAAVAEREKAPTEEDVEKGLLDYYIQLEEASTRFGQLMDRVTAATELIGTTTAERSQELERLNLRPGPTTAKLANVVAMRAAEDLNAFADELTEVMPGIETSVSEISEAMNGYLEWLSSLDREALASTDVENFRKAALELLPAIREGLVSVGGFRDSTANLRGFSRYINSASNRVVSTLGRLLSTWESLEAQVVRALSVTESLEQQASSDQAHEESVLPPQEAK
jgi:hypothetical protein